MAKVPTAAEILPKINRLGRVHERYRRQRDDRQTDGRQHKRNVNLSSRSPLINGCETIIFYACYFFTGSTFSDSKLLQHDVALTATEARYADFVNYR